jgi:tetratricopeptide (TPR) repeat protein
MNWKEVLGWNDDVLEDIRFVGYAYIKQGLYDVALTIFEGLLTISKENAYDLQTLGALHLQKDNSLLALQYLDRALKIDPENPQALLNRTKALFTLGYRKQAITEAKRLLASSDSKISKTASALLLAFPAQRDI